MYLVKEFQRKVSEIPKNEMRISSSCNICNSAAARPMETRRQDGNYALHTLVTAIRCGKATGLLCHLIVFKKNYRHFYMR